MHNKRSKIKPDEDLPSPGTGSMQVWQPGSSHEPSLLLLGAECTFPVTQVFRLLALCVLHTRVARVKWEQLLGCRVCGRMEAEREADGEAPLTSQSMLDTLFAMEK